MNDPAIRQILRETELSNFIYDQNSKIVEELTLPVAKARIDIAVINGYFHGYEIKSASDTLNRLPSQIEAYTKVFDYLTVVTENKYHQRILDIIPSWIGMIVCKNEKGISSSYQIRKPKLNRKKQSFFLIQLLWREEIIEILQEYNLAFRKKDRNWLLCELISNKLEIELINQIVREKLKTRTNWKI